MLGPHVLFNILAFLVCLEKKKCNIIFRTRLVFGIRLKKGKKFQNFKRKFQAFWKQLRTFEQLLTKMYNFRLVHNFLTHSNTYLDNIR